MITCPKSTSIKSTFEHTQKGIKWKILWHKIGIKNFTTKWNSPFEYLFDIEIWNRKATLISIKISLKLTPSITGFVNVILQSLLFCLFGNLVALLVTKELIYKTWLEWDARNRLRCRFYLRLDYTKTARYLWPPESKKIQLIQSPTSSFFLWNIQPLSIITKINYRIIMIVEGTFNKLRVSFRLLLKHMRCIYVQPEGTNFA